MTGILTTLQSLTGLFESMSTLTCFWQSLNFNMP